MIDVFLQVGCLRMMTAGSRKVAMVDAVDVVNFMLKKGSKDANFNMVPSWLASATNAVLSEFIEDGHRLWIMTMSQGDMLFTPAGYVCTHNVLGSTSVVGYKVISKFMFRELFGT
jgi:hypothetical protein